MDGSVLLILAGIYYTAVVAVFMPAVIDSLKGLVRGEPSVTLRTIRLQQRGLDKPDESIQCIDPFNSLNPVPGRSSRRGLSFSPGAQWASAYRDQVQGGWP